MDISFHEAWFASFASNYCQAQAGDCSPMELKIQHTDLVLEHARRIIAAHDFSPPLARATALAALYHDVGRFPQYARWRTFKDSQSVNHGLLGVKILKTRQALVSEDSRTRQLVLAAVGMHNRFAIPGHIAADLQQVVHAVRDADKCDIMRIMVDELNKSGPKHKAVVLHVQDDPLLWTAKVVEDILTGRVAAYADLRSINDFRLLLCSWLFDIRYGVSKVFIKKSGYIDKLLQNLPPAAPVQQARQRLLAALAAVPLAS